MTDIANGKVKRMGLTNHHVVREAAKGFSFTTLPDSDEAVHADVPMDSELDSKPTSSTLSEPR